MKLAMVLALLWAGSASAATPAEMTRWRSEAARITITRDDWGIAHVHGRSDADAVFGAIYAQAEDDFPRIEANYLTALGRTAEAEGEKAIWADLRQRLYVDPADLQARYRASPVWLRALMDAWADGLNFFLATHPGTKAKVLTRFEPWMALSFTEGSIGGDIERIDLAKLQAFYGNSKSAYVAPIAAQSFALRDVGHNDFEPRGSNGIAIAPKLTRDGHALLLINPHTSFFFRSELGMESDAGLHAYGASTWGQFFLYQGWNEHLGWMHTSSGVDAVDEFRETIVGKSYRYGAALRPLVSKPVTLRYAQANGAIASRTFTTYATHHGPIVAKEGADWVSFAMMYRPIPALEQSWLRTKATNFAAYMKVAGLQANSSNDTILAAREGTIAYLHPQYVPLRDNRFDYRGTVDGSATATDWRGLTALAALPQVIDPRTGWLYNSNDAPWRAAGADSPSIDAFPRYMDSAGANPRGDHATALLGQARAMTPQDLIRLAYDPWMPAFDRMLPKLFSAYDALGAGDQRRAALADAIGLLRGWDKRASATSEPTSLACFYGEALWAKGAGPARSGQMTVWDWMDTRATPSQLLDALGDAAAKLTRDFGSVHVAWGEINRFQRNDAAIVQTFADAKPSNPVPFGSARWGSLASFGARAYPGTKRWYGTSGNSFVAVVEFGPKVRAWAVTAGGESGDPASPHFKDQAGRYASGDLRPVYFYGDDLKGHIERTYHPGE